MTGDVSRPSFWEDLYHRKDDRWELGEPAPPLARLLALGPPAPGGGRVAVVGCGRGHDARLLSRHGYAVWGFDFAPYAIEEARRLAASGGSQVCFEQRDVFSLPDDFPSFFDLVWEHTCYCAIDPARRDEYIAVLHGIIAPGGSLLALFYPVGEGTEGPPFPTTEEELRRRLAPRFQIESMEAPADSLPHRQGKERLVRAIPITTSR